MWENVERFTIMNWTKCVVHEIKSATVSIEQHIATSNNVPVVRNSCSFKKYLVMWKFFQNIQKM